MSAQLLTGAVAYNLETLAQHQQEIESWRLISANLIIIPCAHQGCSVQYRLLVPIDAFNAEIQNYKNRLANILHGSCPYHPGRIRLKAPDSSADRPDHY
jgi:hypothetical protein